MPIVIFFIVLISIWTLSAVASSLNKQKEAERRRRLAAQLQMSVSGRTVARAPQSPRQISAGIAALNPDVLLPPMPMRAPIRRQQPPQVRTPKASPLIRAAKAARAVIRQPAQRRGAQVAQQSIQAPVRATEQVLQPSAAPVASMHRQVSQGIPHTVDAPTLARWLTPLTLRRQFILTEVLQPPLSLRERNPFSP